MDINDKQRKKLQKRHSAERRFALYCKLAVAFTSLLLFVLLYNIIVPGISGLQRTEIAIDVELTDDITNIKQLRKKASKLYKAAFIKEFPDVSDRKDKRLLYKLISRTASGDIRKAWNTEEELSVRKKTIWVAASDVVDMYAKGHINKDLPESRRPLNDKQISWINTLQQKQKLRTVFNKEFFAKGDSRKPEQAGFLGAIIGSLLTILVCLAASFPIGVLSATYLEEFAKPSRLKDFIEVNINNLAAVPSIVYGLLGLAVYLNFFGMPRSAPIVGGLTLALLVLPTIIITTRVSLQSVPPSIRQAAMGLGASKLQVVVHHVLPLAMPGIMTGTILAVARAIGETAPLLMIGMVAFIVDIPKGLFDSATVMPVQIYIWASSPEMGFVEKTAAGILVLITILLLMNALAIYLRKRYERKW